MVAAKSRVSNARNAPHRKAVVQESVEREMRSLANRFLVMVVEYFRDRGYQPPDVSEKLLHSLKVRKSRS